MHDVLPIDIAGERLDLHADRALYWPARNSLLIADLHLGKGDSLRAAGIPVPTGGSAHDLARLDALIRRLGAERLWILGDLLHGARMAGSWREHWRAFRQQHASLDIRLVTGNHDGAAPNAGLDIACHPDEIEDGPFLLAHQPARHAPAGLLRICGHLHPVVRLPRLPGRFPAFVIGSSQIVLPAFSAFTGGTPADPLARRVACVNGHLLSMPAGHSL
ncbi:ligase-associated DNA damage response endonuclease PdeM [Pseudochelatococcus sp. B33]